MDSSGVNIVGSPVNGLANRTPSSVILEKDDKLTIWKPVPNIILLRTKT